MLDQQSLEALLQAGRALTDDEVAERQARFGPNVLVPEARNTARVWLLRFFLDPMVLLLLTAGFLAGALAFVPNIGAFLAGAPAVAIAFSVSPRLAIAVVIMYWIVHIADDFIAGPIIERRLVRLPPILTLLLQVVLAGAAGALGIALAAPLLAVTIVIIHRLWVQPMEEAG